MKQEECMVAVTGMEFERYKQLESASKALRNLLQKLIQLRELEVKGSTAIIEELSLKLNELDKALKL